MDNRVDAGVRDPLTSGIRTEPTLGNEAREGHGETRPRTGPSQRKTEGRGRCDVRRRRERSPDGPHRHDRQEGCLDRPRDPLPTRVDACPPLPAAYDAALDAGLAALGLRLSDDARADDRRPRPAPARLERRDQPDGDPRSGGDRVRHVLDSLTGAARARGSGASTAFVDLGSGGGFPGLPLAATLPVARALLVESVAKKARFLETVVAGDRASATVVAGRCRSGPRRWQSVPAARRDGGRRPGASAPLAELDRARVPAPRVGRLARRLEVARARSPAGGRRAGAARRAIAAIDPAATIVIEPAVPATRRRPALADLADHRLVVVTAARRRRSTAPGRATRRPAGAALVARPSGVIRRATCGATR